MEIAGVGLGVLVFAATLVTLIVFHGQLVEMRNQTDLIRSQISANEHDSIAARRGARQQNRALSQQVEAIIAAERPWLGITIVIPDDLTKPGNAVITVANTGRSAALITKFQTAEGAYTGSLPTNPHYPVNGATIFSRALLTPNMGAPSNFAALVLTPPQMKIITDGTQTLYVYAFVDYVDIRNNTTHSTRGCMYYARKLAKWQGCSTYYDAN